MKKYIYGALSMVIFCFMFAFGIDKEVARQDYIAAMNKGVSQQITGCLFETNCSHYTKLLGDM